VAQTGIEDKCFHNNAPVKKLNILADIIALMKILNNGKRAAVNRIPVRG
jgi:hypothetical protein